MTASHHYACICYIHRWDCLLSRLRSEFKFMIESECRGKGGGHHHQHTAWVCTTPAKRLPPFARSLSLSPSCECCVMLSDITRSVEQQVWALLTQPAMLPCENNNTQPTPPSPTFTLNKISQEPHKARSTLKTSRV